MASTSPVVLPCRHFPTSSGARIPPWPPISPSSCVRVVCRSSAWDPLSFPSGLMDDGTKLTILGIWMALFVVFSGRKFTRPIKDDIGDKSVFIFNALHEPEKAALVEKLQEQNYFQKRN